MTQTHSEGLTAGRSITMAQAINEALDEALAEDPRVFLLGEDIADPIGGVMKITTGLSTKHGTHRVRATPIAEQAIIGAAIGAAMVGYRPVAEIMFMDFLGVCMDGLANHAAKLRYMSGGRTGVPITVRTHIGRGNSAAQHSQSLEAWLMAVPGLKVAIPSNANDAKHLLRNCIFDDDPCVFVESMKLIYNRSETLPLDASDDISRARVVRPGTDVTILSWGTGVPDAIAASREVESDGISAEVVDARWLVPLDLNTVLASVRKTRRLLIVHAASTFAGPGAEIAALIQAELFGHLSAPVRRLGAPYAPIPYSPALVDHFFPTPASIAAAVKATVAGTSAPTEPGFE